jgi:uracil DNA glycosylase
MDYEKFKDKLGDWGDYLKPFIESEKMDDIYKKLKGDTKKGKKICPDSEDTFNVFKAVPPNKLTVIWVLADPYPWVKNNITVANGIAMDCAKTGICQPSLETFYEGIEQELYSGLNLDYFKDPSLKYLTDQGVMFLNSDLTVELNKPSSHKGVWKEFMKYFLEDILNQYFRGIPFVLAGKNSEAIEAYINPLIHYIFKVEHPAAAVHTYRPWKTDGVFHKINKILKENNNMKIDWLYELPF